MPRQKFKLLSVLSAIAGLFGFSALAGLLVAALVTPALAVTSMTANSTIGIFEALPDYMEIGQLSQKNVMYGKRNGKWVQFAQVFEQNREEVSWDEVSPFIKDAVVAGEDRRFYEHGGVDVQSILRAAAANFRTDEIQSGASTIAMQLVKNINIQNALELPNEEDKEKALKEATETSLDRKLKEAKLAIGLEKKYTKNQILLAYLNITAFGGTTYGIESAAQQYLSKSADDVTLAEAASLVAIVQLPNYRNLDDPEKYPSNKSRRDKILGNMLELGMITQAQYTEAINTAIEDYVKLNDPNNGCTYALEAKTFCDYIIKSVKDMSMLGDTAEERQANWDRGGYKVYTTIDLDQQENAEKQLQAYAPRTENRFKLGAAVSAVQPGTGRILVMAQNKTFNDTGNGDPVTTTAVNYNTDKAYGGSSGFPAASTYKLFTLTDWLLKGHGLYEVVNGSPHDSRVFKADCVGGYVYNPPYHPANDAGERGPWTVIRATARSVNAAFISMAEQLDLCDIRDVAVSMGAHRADGNPLSTLPSSVLGVNEVAPMTMASAIATIGAGGIYCSPIAVISLVDANGTDLGGQNADCHRAIPAAVAAGAAVALQAVMAGGGTGQSSNPHNGTPLVGKSGTDDNATHTWVISSSTKVAMAVWVGNIIGDTSLRGIYVNGTYGASIRHRIGLRVLGPLTSEYGGSSFPDPPGRMLSGITLEIPNLEGKTPEEAKALLKSLGLTYSDGGPKPSAAPLGSVAFTNPVAGTKVSKGYQIVVYTSDGTLYVEMPNVLTMSYHDAQNALVAAGFSPGKISPVWEQVAVPGDPTCVVTATNPAAGAATSKQHAVTLTISSTVGGVPEPGCGP